MLQVRDISYTAGERHILSGVDWNIPSGKRMALIGPNGAGKTTLLRILAGELPATGGQIMKSRSVAIGYLPQEETMTGAGTVLDAVMAGHGDIVVTGHRMEKLHHRLDSESGDHSELLKKLGELEHRFAALGGYELETGARAILSGLGFREADFHRPLTEFSGGWRMRALLARLLIRKPDFLLLDEPTNHLDLQSLEWLERYLMQFSGSVVVVSHDRFLIDRLARDIYEIECGKLIHYTGSYRDYMVKKEQNRALLEKRRRELKEERERHQRFIDRFRYKASKASQVQSRIKMLEKMETVELPPVSQTIRFSLKVASPSYKDVLSIRDMSFRYAKDWIYKKISLDLFRGEKVAVVGVNGAGKTTLTRLITGELQPQEGSVRLGRQTAVGYYAQHHVEALHLDATVIDEVASTAAHAHTPQLRDLLGLFQFAGDDVFKKTGVLSGGEKARVSLAKILAQPVNFLIMDEPTNHLDLSSREVLEKALSGYDGTLLLISHDRYFLDRIVRKVMEITDGQIRIYEGNYSDYLRKKEGELPVGSRIRSSVSSQKAEGGNPNKTDNEERRMLRKECNRQANRIREIEAQIEKLENRKGELEHRLNQPETYRDSQLYHTLNGDYQSVNNELESCYLNWEDLHRQVEELEARLSAS